nr:hypothetical protein Ahy_A06g030094 [Ipomoea batatas]
MMRPEGDGQQRRWWWLLGLSVGRFRSSVRQGRAATDGGGGKLVLAFAPRRDLAAPSYAIAASSGVSNVPNQTRPGLSNLLLLGWCRNAQWLLAGVDGEWCHVVIGLTRKMKGAKRRQRKWWWVVTGGAMVLSNFDWALGGDD